VPGSLHGAASLLRFFAMRKLLFLLSLLALPLLANAQLRFGYFSRDSVFRAMPEYATAQKNMADLRAKYDAEMKRAEDEFNAKYEEFLGQQRELVPSIMRKRQTELQEMMDKNVAFKKEATRLLDEARNDAYAPLKRKLDGAVAEIGRARGYAFILNTDGDACPYIDPAYGEDITEKLKVSLSIR